MRFLHVFEWVFLFSLKTSLVLSPCRWAPAAAFCQTATCLMFDESFENRDGFTQAVAMGGE